MKKYYPLWSILLLSFFATDLLAQAVFQEGTPYSFESELKSDIPTKMMPPVNLNKLQKEDELDEKGGLAPRFGFLHETKYNLDNAGRWETLPNGDRLWRLHITAPEALTININYSKFDLPWGGKLFVYSSPKPTIVLGPFTLDNEKSNGRFATGFTYGEACTIEYYEPKEAIGKSQIEIDGIVHGYKTIPDPKSEFEKAFQGSGSCNNDVDCPLSAGWEDQIKSVGMHILASGTRWCSGALINNTGNDCKPYFLSANHCFSSAAGSSLNDIFMFNYDSPTPACSGTPGTDGPTNQTVQGATVIARAGDSDFYLVELDNNPLDFYDVYYSGWNRANSGVTNTTAIHHPSGDVKKFSIDNDPPTSSSFGGSPNGTHWRVGAWDNGTTEPGSSGSPIFDQNKRIIGQLHGGTASCNLSNDPDWYGKVWYSWDQNGAAATSQLAPWLDPIGTGVMFMDGNDCSVPVPPTAAFSPSNNSTFSFCTTGTIPFANQSAGNPTTWAWTFSGAGVSPTTSSAQNPTVTVTNSGTLTVSLTVTNSLGTDNITHTYPVVISPCTTNTYCDSPNLSIPDNNATGVSSTFSVGLSGTIADINIDIDLTHTYIGDLEIVVSHNGTSVTILGTGNCANNDIDATFDDEGTISAGACNAGPALSGLVIPTQALSAFDGMDQAGNWTINVSDNAGQDLGTLNEWCLIISSNVGSTCYSMLNNGNGLSNNETGVADYESSDWIETSGPTVIQSGAQVDYDATTYIILNAGFEVKVGAIFNAFIDGCNSGTGGVNLRDENPNTQLKIKPSNTSKKTEAKIIDLNKN